MLFLAAVDVSSELRIGVPAEQQACERISAGSDITTRIVSISFIKI